MHHEVLAIRNDFSELTHPRRTTKTFGSRNMFFDVSKKFKEALEMSLRDYPVFLSIGKKDTLSFVGRNLLQELYNSVTISEKAIHQS